MRKRKDKDKDKIIMRITNKEKEKEKNRKMDIPGMINNLIGRRLSGKSMQSPSRTKFFPSNPVFYFFCFIIIY